MISGRLAPFSRSSARSIGGGRGKLRGRRIDHLDQRRPAGLGVHHLGEQLGRQVEIDAAGPARHGGADRARHADADIGGVQHAERGLAQRLGDGELVHLLVVALLQVDDLALARAADQDHREAVRGRVGQRGQAVEEAGRRDGQADARLLGQEPGDRRRIAGVLLMPERDHAHARGLRHAAQIGDRDAGHAVDRLDAVQLQRVDDQVEAVRQGVGFGLADRLRFAARWRGCCGHERSSVWKCQFWSASSRPPCASICAARPNVCSRTSRSARSASRRSRASMMSR